jgi:hypothetical protein
VRTSTRCIETRGNSSRQSWEQKDLAETSGISLPTIKRLETQPGQLAAQSRTIDDLRCAHEKAGVEFIAGANLATQDQ